MVVKIQKTVTFLLLALLIVTLTPANTEKVQCPSKCHCSTDFTAVKCRGYDKFPVLEFAAGVRTLDLSRGQITYIEKKDLEAYENLQFLDIRHNGIKSVSPGLFSDMTTLRELYVSDNPWSCDKSTLHVLQMELTAFADKNSHLDNFDGGKMECFDPPNMKGKKPLHLIYPTVQVLHVHKVMKGRMADQHQIPGGVIALLVFLVMLLSAAVVGTVWVFRENLQHLLMNVWRLKPTSDPANKMEAGEMHNKNIVTDHISQGLETSKTSSSKGGSKIKPKGQLDDKSILMESMKKRRRKSLGLPASQSNSASSSDDEAAVNLPNNKKTPDKLDKKTILMESMKKRRRKSLGLPASQSNSASSSDDEAAVKPANNMNTSQMLDSKTILIDSMKKRRRMSQGLPTADISSESNSENETEVSSTCFLEERMRRQRQQSCGFAEGEISFSEEESGFTLQ